VFLKWNNVLQNVRVLNIYTTFMVAFSFNNMFILVKYVLYIVIILLNLMEKMN
jgi:hypothetical protein